MALFILFILSVELLSGLKHFPNIISALQPNPEAVQIPYLHHSNTPPFYVTGVPCTGGTLLGCRDVYLVYRARESVLRVVLAGTAVYAAGAVHGLAVPPALALRRGVGMHRDTGPIAKQNRQR